MKEIKTILFVFYSHGKKEDKNFPSFIQDDGVDGIACQYDEENMVIRLLPLDTEKHWEEISSPANEDITIKVFSHGIKEQNEELSNQIDKDKRVGVNADYSSSDPSYEQMWKEIRNAKNCRELAVILEYWMNSCVVDPLRRIKHRAINLFLPLSTDIQFLLEIWRRNDFSKAKTHLEELKAEWSDGKSPVSILYRLWYMLVGKHLNWKEGDLPEMPTDVSLPGGKNPDGKEEPLSLYDWLTKYFGKNQVQKLKEWQKLLADAQIDQRQEGKFHVISGGGVYCFSKMITEMIKYPGNIKPNEKFTGFRPKNSLNEEFNIFLDWLNTLNDSLESLITQCQKKS